MISKQEIKRIRSLGQKKYRLRHKQFLVEGPKLVTELLNSAYKVEEVYSTSDRFTGTRLTEQQLRQVSQLSTPNEVLAVVNLPTPREEVFLDEPLALVLDGISDPGNLGTVLRIADWFGIDSVWCSIDTVDAYNPKTVQASMGSIFRVRTEYRNLHHLLPEWKATFPDKTIYGAQLVGDDPLAVPLESGLLVMGSESHGLSKKVSDHIDRSLSIPRKGKAESLNVAVATGILCSAFQFSLRS